MDGGLLLFLGLAGAAFALWVLNLRATARRTGERSEEIGGYRMQAGPGMEATDIEAFNAAMSRNAPLGEVPQELQGLGREISTHVAPVKDDETYARRFHGAFGKTETKR